MKARLQAITEHLRSSFWFVPLLLSVGAVLVANGLVALDDSAAGRRLAGSVGWIWSGGADGARSLLSTVASSMITVAGTVFSITIAALTLASSQFGPRLLRNFTRDVGNQVVLGTFVSTFLYCLVVLRSVRSQNEGGFVPYVAITAGLLLAAASIGVLIYFIHHVAASIQVEHLVATVGRELRGRIGQKQADEAEAGPGFGGEWRGEAVPAGAAGYVQQVDRAAIVAQACSGDLEVRLERQPGDFVIEGEALMRVRARGADFTPEQAACLLRTVGIGDQRTPTADPRYGLQQLTEIACRALSPGINDPFTAMACTDWLADALARIARQRPASACRRDAAGVVRLEDRPVGFAEFARLSIGPIRAYGAGSVMVTTHVLQALGRLAGCVTEAGDRAALREEARLTATAALLAAATEDDRKTIERALREALAQAGDA